MKLRRQFLYTVLCLFTTVYASAQSRLSRGDWADSVFKSLSKEERIAQLMVIRAHSNLGADHVAKVEELVRKYNVGAFCWFQGGPVRQALLNNYYQSIAKTPILNTIDGEWGLAMRLDSVTKFPYQLTLGALKDETLVYRMGVAVGEQMKRMGIHVNYAPVVDINNNPDNPVIGYRSFGEDREKVARFGVAYTQGMQSAGIMACAKHFPGHGDVAVDSHYDLPLIAKNRQQLDSLELYPFTKQFAAGVGSVMIAHLAIPVIDNRPNRPTSLSENNINKLLRDSLKYNGLTFTDALEMKGVAKFFPAGEAAVEALVAGNDMLCLPEDVPAAISAIKTAVRKKRLKQDDVDEKVRKVLRAKWDLGLYNTQYVDTANLLTDLNKNTDEFNRQVARNTVAVLKNNTNFFPLMPKKHWAYVQIGRSPQPVLQGRMAQDFAADSFFFPLNGDTLAIRPITQALDTGKYDAVIAAVFTDVRTGRPSNNFNIGNAALQLWDSLQKHHPATFLFGNVYAAKNFVQSPTLVAMHQDDVQFQNAAADFLRGSISANGSLAVTVKDLPYGTGYAVNNRVPVGVSPQWLVIDSIVNDGLARKAYPGAVVMAVHRGQIKYHKAFGRYELDPFSLPVTLESIYDLASVTKVSATTVSLMKLYEEGRLDLDKTLGDYLPFVEGTDKAPLTVRNILLHQAGLNPYIQFYRETIDPTTKGPSPRYYNTVRDSLFTIPVARDVWLRRDWNDSMLQRIVKSRIETPGQYVYSDNDFILLGKIVENISGTTLDQYAYNTFYRPLGMTTTGFKAGERFGSERVVPTERDNYFRKQLLRGYVHDEGAAMFGGVSGHAGLFSNAYDLALLYQMLLNGGELNGVRFLNKSTIDAWTAYGSNVSRRGLGFDKPEKDNGSRRDPYPSKGASPQTYGHTGFTGTCVWVDPASELVYIFLSNRVYNSRTNNLLGQLGIRGKVQDAIYRAIAADEGGKTNAVKGF